MYQTEGCTPVITQWAQAEFHIRTPFPVRKYVGYCIHSSPTHVLLCGPCKRRVQQHVWRAPSCHCQMGAREWAFTSDCAVVKWQLSFNMQWHSHYSRPTGEHGWPHVLVNLTWLWNMKCDYKPWCVPSLSAFCDRLKLLYYLQWSLRSVVCGWACSVWQYCAHSIFMKRS